MISSDAKEGPDVQFLKFLVIEELATIFVVQKIFLNFFIIKTSDFTSLILPKTFLAPLLFFNAT